MGTQGECTRGLGNMDLEIRGLGTLCLGTLCLGTLGLGIRWVRIRWVGGSRWVGIRWVGGRRWVGIRGFGIQRVGTVSFGLSDLVGGPPSGVGVGLLKINPAEGRQVHVPVDTTP